VGHEFDHSPPSTPKVKSEWNYISICLHGMDRDNFIFTLLIEMGNLVYILCLCQLNDNRNFEILTVFQFFFLNICQTNTSKLYFRVLCDAVYWCRPGADCAEVESQFN